MAAIAEGITRSEPGTEATVGSSEVSKELREQIETWIRENNKIRILVAGKTGMGKSSLVNILVGNEVATESEGLAPQTADVEGYSGNINGVDVTVYDSPGLVQEKGTDLEHLRGIAKNCKKVHLFLYCIRMDDSYRQSDEDAIRKFTVAFGKELWENAVFILTFANNVEPRTPGDREDPVKRCEYFKSRLHQWEEKLHMVLNKADVAAKVPVIPAGCGIASYPASASIHLPDREDWLVVLWLNCLCRANTVAQVALLKLNRKRFKFSDQGNDIDFVGKPLSHRPIVLKVLRKAAGGGITGAVAGLAGLSFGPIGAVGVPIGLLLGVVLGIIDAVYDEKIST